MIHICLFRAYECTPPMLVYTSSVLPDWRAILEVRSHTFTEVRIAKVLCVRIARLLYSHNHIESNRIESINQSNRIESSKSIEH